MEKRTVRGIVTAVAEYRDGIVLRVGSRRRVLVPIPEENRGEGCLADEFLRLLGNEIVAEGVWETHYGGMFRSYLRARRVSLAAPSSTAVSSGSVHSEDNARRVIAVLRAVGKQKLAGKAKTRSAVLEKVCHDPFSFCGRGLDFPAALSIWRLIWGPGVPIPPTGVVEALRFFYTERVFPSPDDLDDLMPVARLEDAVRWLERVFRISALEFGDTKTITEAGKRRGLKFFETDEGTAFRDLRVDSMVSKIRSFLEELDGSPEPLAENASPGEVAEFLLLYGALVITGRAGTGKTTLLNALKRTLEDQGRMTLSVALTGRAAGKLEDGQTLAYALGGARLRDRFPEAYDAILVDEASQFSLYHMSRTIRGLHPHQRLVLAGDPKQLPPIEGPRVYPWMIQVMREKNLVLELTTPHRFDRDRRVFLIEYSNAFCVRFVAGLFALVAENNGVEWLILSPIHRGPVGVRALNRTVKQALSARNLSDLFSAAREADGPFEITPGDRVMPVENIYDGRTLILTNKQAVGTVLSVRNGSASVMFPEGTREVPVSALAPSYALEFWSAEGQETDWTLVVCPDPTRTPNISGPREPHIWETVATRARKLTVILVREGRWPRFLREKRIDFEVRKLRFADWKERARRFFREELRAGRLGARAVLDS